MKCSVDMEYKTTIGTYRRGQWHHDPCSSEGGYLSAAEADSPVPPLGDGWSLHFTTAADGLLFWTWVREIA